MFLICLIRCFTYFIEHFELLLVGEPNNLQTAIPLDMESCVLSKGF